MYSGLCHKAAREDLTLPFTLIPFSSLACMWHGSSAESHKSSAATSVKPCLQIPKFLSFSLGCLAAKSVGDV